MKTWIRLVQVVAGIAAAFVAISSVTLAIRQASWEPVISVGWLPAVIVATRPGAYGRCFPRGNRHAG